VNSKINKGGSLNRINFGFGILEFGFTVRLRGSIYSKEFLVALLRGASLKMIEPSDTTNPRSKI
jgi:hypothetical protein